MKTTFFFFAFLLALASLASIDARDQLSRGALRRENLTERRLESKSKDKAKGDKSKKSKSKDKAKGDKSKKSKSKGKGDKSKKSKSKGKGDKSKKSKSKGKGDKSKKSKSKDKSKGSKKSKDKEARNVGILTDAAARTAAAADLFRQAGTQNAAPITNAVDRAAIARTYGLP